MFHDHGLPRGMLFPKTCEGDEGAGQRREPGTWLGDAVGAGNRVSRDPEG